VQGPPGMELQACRAFDNTFNHPRLFSVGRPATLHCTLTRVKVPGITCETK
jgi:hypothetical protein